MAVHRRGDLGQAGHEAVELVPHLRVLLRHRVADRVRHVDGRGALIERYLKHLGGERELGARGVHRRELHVVAVLARLRHGGARLALHVLAGRLELMLDVDVASGDEGVDARALGVLDCVPGGIDVLRVRAGQSADHWAMHLAGDGLHGLEVAGRGDREAGLDHIDPEPRELVRDLELLLLVQRDPRRLLPVAQGRVEDLYSVLLTAVHVAPASSLAFGSRTVHPPKGRRSGSRKPARNDTPQSVQQHPWTPSGESSRGGYSPPR